MKLLNYEECQKISAAIGHGGLIDITLTSLGGILGFCLGSADPLSRIDLYSSARNASIITTTSVNYPMLLTSAVVMGLMGYTVSQLFQLGADKLFTSDKIPTI